MTRQAHLWDDCTATITSGRPSLFDPNAVEAGDVDLRCETCGAYLVRTPSGFLACPNGCGKLMEETALCGRWFDDSEGDE